MDDDCSVSSCARPLYAKGLCQLHYERKRLGRPSSASVQQRAGWTEDDFFPRCKCGLRLFTRKERKEKSCGDCLPRTVVGFVALRMRAEGY